MRTQQLASGASLHAALDTTLTALAGLLSHVDSSGLCTLLPAPQSKATSPVTSPTSRHDAGDKGHTTPPLLQPLLHPELFYPHLTPELRNRLVALLLHMCAAAGQGAFAACLLPWLVPLFDMAERDRGWFGADAADPAHAASDAQHDAASMTDRGYWDVVWLLYPEAVDAVGLPVLRDMLRDWKALERGLQARYGWTPLLGSVVPRATPALLLGGGGDVLPGMLLLLRRDAHLCCLPPSTGTQAQTSTPRDWHWLPADSDIAQRTAAAPWPVPPSATTIGTRTQTGDTQHIDHASMRRHVLGAALAPEQSPGAQLEGPQRGVQGAGGQRGRGLAAHCGGCEGGSAGGGRGALLAAGRPPSRCVLTMVLTIDCVIRPM